MFQPNKRIDIVLSYLTQVDESQEKIIEKNRDDIKELKKENDSLNFQVKVLKAFIGVISFCVIMIFCWMVPKVREK